MIEIYDECKKAIANNKCSECNEYYSCYLCDYVEERYEQGIADAELVHKEMCESCIHKVSAEDIEQIRADAIDEFESLLYQFGYYEPFSMKLEIYHEDLKRLIEQLKEYKR